MVMDLPQVWYMVSSVAYRLCCLPWSRRVLSALCQHEPACVPGLLDRFGAVGEMAWLTGIWYARNQETEGLPGTCDLHGSWCSRRA